MCKKATTSELAIVIARFNDCNCFISTSIKFTVKIHNGLEYQTDVFDDDKLAAKKRVS